MYNNTNTNNNNNIIIINIIAYTTWFLFQISMNEKQRMSSKNRKLNITKKKMKENQIQYNPSKYISNDVWCNFFLLNPGGDDDDLFSI